MIPDSISNSFLEGDYITVVGPDGKKHGKVIQHDGTTMTVKWYSGFQWLFIGSWLWIRKQVTILTLKIK